ncbi:MAG: metallophosphoesterase family protein [Planctomycetes bacterium]|nr:metallophosphoesterase family protein [Planctomycetota bacterium]
MPALEAMPKPTKHPTHKKRGGKFQRAKLRQIIFTKAIDRILKGRLMRRHHAQPIAFREIEIAVPNWPRAFDGLRIGHLSDLHWGELMPLKRAIELVAQLDDAKVDLLACTGDVVDLEWRGCEPLLAAMGKVRAPLGHFLVLGNHDHLDDATSFAAAATHHRLDVLHQKVVTRRRAKHDLRIAGIDWHKSPKALQKSVESIAHKHPHLLLTHNPKAFASASTEGIPLVLAGHTHGGQVALRRNPQKNLALAHRHSSGLYEKGFSRLFVNVGAGAWFPYRRNVPAEIVVLVVRRESKINFVV